MVNETQIETAAIVDSLIRIASGVVDQIRNQTPCGEERNAALEYRIAASVRQHLSPYLGGVK